MWRVLVQPLKTMAYSDAEQGDDEAGRYDDALTPPLFLLITVVLMNLIALAAHLPQPTAGAGPCGTRSSTRRRTRPCSAP